MHKALLMNKIIVLSSSFLLILLNFSAIGQIPELQLGYENDVITLADLEDKLDKTSDEKARTQLTLQLARLAYKVGDVDKAVEYFLRITDLDALVVNDLKTLACALQINGSTALAEEIFNNFTSNLAPEFKDNYQGVFDQVQAHGVFDRSESIEAGEGNTIYLVKNNKSFQGNINCDGTISVSRGIGLPMEDRGIGSFSFNINDNSYVFSVKQDDGKYKLYHAFWSTKKNKWKKIRKVNMFTANVNSAFPHFNNGILYFASDHPDGFGGYDLYKANYIDGSFGAAENLGSLINSDFHEINPNFQNNKLNFSSNGFPGFGGFDLYEYDAENKRLQHLSIPINSPSNDWKSVTIDKDKYLCLRDLSYKTSLLYFENEITAPLPSLRIGIHGMSLGKDGRRLGNQIIYIHQKGELQGYYTTSEEDGSYEFTLQDSGQFTLETKHPMMKDYSAIISVKSSDLEIEHQIRMDRKEIIVSHEPRSGETKNSGEGNSGIRKPDEQIPQEIHNDPVVETPSQGPQHSVKPPKVTSGNDHLRGINSQGDEYLAIIGTSPSINDAFRFQKRWQGKFDSDVLIYHFPNKNLYRIGLDVGQTRSEALANFYRHKKVFSNAWLLAP